MKEFNVVTQFNVALFGRHTPLDVGVCYGKVEGVTYMFHPEKRVILTHDGTWGKRCTCRETIDKIWRVIHANEKKWAGLKVVRFDKNHKHDERVHAAAERRYETMSHHTVEGAPVRREVQKQYTRFVGSCYSQRAIEGKGYTTCEYEERVRDVVVYDEGGPRVINSRGDSYRGYERPYDYKKPMEVGQNTAGPEQFLSKRNSIVLDRTHGKPEKKDVKASPLSSHKRAERVRSTSELINEMKEVETEHASRVASMTTTRPTGHVFLGKPGGDARRKIIHGEQV